MERLTEKCWRNLDPWECCGQDHYCTRGCHDLGGCTGGCIVPKSYRHLAAYEDTMPLERALELAQAEKDERLVVPCKVGDMVWTNLAMSGWYFRDKDKPYSARVVFIGLNDSDAVGNGIINVAYEKHNHMMQFTFSDIGKTVFLTRKEAEAALKNEGGS